MLANGDLRQNLTRVCQTHCTSNWIKGWSYVNVHTCPYVSVHTCAYVSARVSICECANMSARLSICECAYVIVHALPKSLRVYVRTRMKCTRLTTGRVHSLRNVPSRCWDASTAIQMCKTVSKKYPHKDTAITRCKTDSKKYSHKEICVKSPLIGDSTTALGNGDCNHCLQSVSHSQCCLTNCCLN